MSQQINTEEFNKAADAILKSGREPSTTELAKLFGVEPEQLTGLLEQWWTVLPDRMRMFGDSTPRMPELPESLVHSFESMWQLAVQEAQSALSTDKQYQQLASEDARRQSESELFKAQSQQAEMDQNYRDLQQQLLQEKHQIEVLDAEISVLKINLATATSEQKAEEQRRLNVEQELNLLQKKIDDSKRTFDQRIIEEQRHGLDQVAKAEADTRYYRSALEKFRDECGRKESALTKDIHNLQAVVAKKDVKLETYKNQIKSLETELKRYKTEDSQNLRERSQLSSQLLSEQNRSKRLEDKVDEMKEELKRINQKNLLAVNDASRRENMLRGQLKDKAEEVMRATARLSTLEKKMTTYEEEIRKLRSRLT
ncbi:DNA-binding protein [Amphritea pacifica]|uniref:DNA-binding protein n=1 Tax=Amphritea pacifica TaxID=2811233 RepID=A0ABS2W624_9GAMM|nr:DNA-binding protein [Amphritea pacifica]MBN0987158.1 DNA-binding protein [Amphritea pacifica]MBN1007836.1 DNA-binding protein [Amphritea pacifica]